MHDVVCDVALSIASRDRDWLTLGEEDVFEMWSDEDTMRGCNLVSLRNAKVSELPDKLECPNPTFFSMHGALEIPNNFFMGVPRLKVLNFANMHFTSLPSSIGSLKTLSSLCLIDCDLEDMAILQICILYLYHSFDGWEGDGIDDPRSNVCLVELQHLFCLTILEVHIRDVQAMVSDMKVVLNSMMLVPCLESLSLCSLTDLEAIFDDQLNAGSFDRLRIIEVLNCNTLNNLFSFSIATELHQLEKIEVFNCDNMIGLIVVKEETEEVIQGIFGDEERIDSYISLFPKLDSLKLSSLPKLKRFCCGIDILIEFPSLREMEVWACPVLKTLHCDITNIVGKSSDNISVDQPQHLFNEKVSCPVLEELWLSQVSGIEKIWKDDNLPVLPFGFQSLTVLKVQRCHKLKYVFASSMVKSFVQLKTLDVSHCNEIKEVIQGILVGEEEKIDSYTSLFPKLDSLKLTWLSNLRRFCCGIDIPIEFPSLKELKIWDCPLLKTLRCDSTNIVGKSSDNISVDQPQHLFNEKVSCPGLEKLYLDLVNGIGKIWSGDQIHVMSFVVKWKSTNIVGKNSDNISVDQPQHLFNEKTLHCDITNIDRKSSDKISLNQPQRFFNEKELSIEDMDNLERLWPNQLSQHSFSKLIFLRLKGCPKLLDVFPLGMLTRFQRLNQLSIWNCKSLEIIFESHPQEEKGNNSTTLQSFSPQLIQSDVIAFEFSCLMSLIFEALPNLRSINREMLTVNWPSLKKMEVKSCDKVEILFASQETTRFRIQQPLFWVNQFRFPKLHQLTLGWNVGVKETWHCNGQQLVSHHFPNLEVVQLVNYTDQVVLLSRGDGQSEEGGEEKSAWVRKINPVPSSASFRNLVTLKVEQCHGIIKLITHSTAKSLVQLREMSISGCRDIEEIIQGADNDDDEIHFPQLNHLELIDLPKLESFCSSRNYTFGFPSLQIVTVADCQKMKMFSGGHSNTPMLHKVGLDRWGCEERWEGNLNSTTQQLFREKGGNDRHNGVEEDRGILTLKF
ncbi:hypothetical protein V6N11_079565 [Hibiscus sabdariffa]|uniref:Disease resistance protein At4g27190-like leucine-rich repeats domain-containing protein n=1 Tax=Hibiscus sabdariffa TaxID=183260 RepID=A0ABR2RWG7_9ROSI